MLAYIPAPWIRHGLWPEIPVISLRFWAYNPIYRMYNPNRLELNGHDCMANSSHSIWWTKSGPIHNYRNVWRGRKVLEDYLHDFICEWIGIYIYRAFPSLIVRLWFSVWHLYDLYRFAEENHQTNIFPVAPFLVCHADHRLRKVRISPLFSPSYTSFGGAYLDYSWIKHDKTIGF